MAELSIRAMEVNDATVVANLLASSFPARLHPYLVYCQSGIANYLGIVVRYPHVFSGHRLYVGVDRGNHVRSFAEFRVDSSTTAKLTYIAVDESARRHGVATQLIKQFILGNQNVRTIELEVFQENSAAHRLYDRLQFSTHSSLIWWRAPLPEAQEPDDMLQFDDWASSMATYRSFGFCRLRGSYGLQPVEFGVTSRTVLRCEERRLSDSRLLGQVRYLIPELRETLSITNASGAPTAGSNLTAILTADVMSVRTDNIVAPS